MKKNVLLASMLAILATPAFSGEPSADFVYGVEAQVESALVADPTNPARLARAVELACRGVLSEANGIQITHLSSGKSCTGEQCETASARVHCELPDLRQRAEVSGLSDKYGIRLDVKFASEWPHP